MNLVSVVGARPNFMKIAPLVRELNRHRHFKHTLIHTGQHYDHAMSRLFFSELRIPRPDMNLEVGSGSHAWQTSRIMMKMEKVLLRLKPDLVIVVGDVNSTMAATLVASKLMIPVAHVEAGLRSFDRSMPEEINRLVTDSLSDILFTTSPEARDNLIKEGISPRKIRFVGNIMIDTLKHHIKRARQTDILNKLRLEPRGYILATLHRPSNVDSEDALTGILSGIQKLQQEMPMVFPMHPRTQARYLKIVSQRHFPPMPNLQVIDPLGYLDFLNLMIHAKGVMTDSGGIQEETTVLGIPCMTVRHNTERPVTITSGTNVLVGTSAKKIVREGRRIIHNQWKKGRVPRYWDGKTARRIVKYLIQWRKKRSS